MGEDALADALDDSGQLVGTDMCVCLVEDGVGCAEIVEELHDALHVTAFLGAGEQFAVGERARAAFAEAVVGLGIESLVAVEERDVAFA